MILVPGVLFTQGGLFVEVRPDDVPSSDVALGILLVNPL